MFTPQDLPGRYGRVVQIGSQGRSQVAAWQAANYIRAGQLGTMRKVTCWHYASPEGDWIPDSAPPAEIDYDLWVGPARWLPYNSKHTHGSFRWLIDFGGGQIRDRGAHIMSIASWIMGGDNTGPVSIDAKGEPPRDGMYDSAVTMEVTYEFKNPDWTLVWAQPGTPSTEIQARYGAVYWGDKGRLTVTYGDGSNTVKGGAGADSCEGGSGDDSLYGGKGPDSVSGGDGRSYASRGASGPVRPGPRRGCRGRRS